MFTHKKPMSKPSCVLLIAVLLVMVSGSDTQADVIFGQATNLGATVNSSADDLFPVLSPDGLELYFTSLRPGGSGNGDIWVAKRASVQNPWGPPSNLGPNVNTPTWEAVWSMSADGLTLYFDSGGPGGRCYQTTRAARDAPWQPRVDLGPAIGPGSGEAIISSDGLELYLITSWPGGSGRWDTWVSTRATPSDPWGTPVNLGPTINTAHDDCPTWISPDGLTLLLGSDRPGGFGNYDVWMTTRPSKSSPWGPARNLGPSINTVYSEEIISISSDGRCCYFDDFGGPHPGGLGAADLWQAPIFPIVDFNSDGKVDEKDLAFLVNDWGISDWMSACDIGPFAWGDGLVDEKDLRVLMESLMTPGPRASGVPCDVVLSWISPSIAKSSDVYLGTSFEAVNTATRDDPCDVLVSWGQQETTYAPEAPLEFSRTYYWRVDTVLGASTTSICKGPVLSFATEPFAYAIQNITATASSSQAGTSPQKTVDGSGLDKNDAHSTNTQDVWQSTATPGPHWIQYEFDKVYALHELWVWNSNQLVEPILGFGARTVKIEYSVDGATWTMLDKVPEFARAPGEPACKPNTTVNFGGVLAKHVKLSIDANWGPVAQTGLAEVRFFYIPDRPWATMP